MKRPKQEDLPGMENRGIKELDALCREYVDVRDERQDLTRREVELQADLLNALKKHKLKTYDHAGIHADLVVEKEKVKVTVAEETEEDETPAPKSKKKPAAKEAAAGVTPIN